ncbi:MAG: hypothetical protein B7Y25_00735 [Alphaproteobacteria bacterium 16-39-46]|nr:MAG: hypothetical protein B7Y25_00735 [Alphaproteobacteria bacterium 16-39-46]OZA44366.1 MAG: hypothetical protein B7X84_00740 [Alphaproteobacteria bacterium 17-39-52]HQS83434.1 hypothetical protein [Alphaproteobacteria bacterium]HQS93198.1 hypothetical protein [Alphaproteobacteria bacterium]
MNLITVTQVVRNFGNIIGRVYYKREEFNIKKGSQIVACLSPPKRKSGLSMAGLERVLKKGLFLSSKELEDFERDIQFMREKKEELIDKWD